ncbi:MAG TPA: hypothetical protein VEA99_05785 [Gemmatimonadaceae bacterium]|nr:hypothetical protein [Gemmatimonadaceae bacterium]
MAPDPHSQRAGRPTIRGARGANAGDDYHELWALREALSLLDPSSELTAITLEGVHPEDSATASPDVWDGVDCAYYFGGEDLASADRAAFDQVKYSTAEPDRPWTVARLTRRHRHTRASSVIGRLGAAFLGYHEQRPDFVLQGRLRIRLVSNQPVAGEVLDALRAPGNSDDAASDNRQRMVTASGVPRRLHDAFFQSLDFSDCGAGSRLALEAEIASTMDAWTHPNARGALDTLRRRVRELMMPEGANLVLTRREVLSWLGFAGPESLFPCPAAFRLPSHIVERAVTDAALGLLGAGEQRICIHGGGGVGKTTALLGLPGRLPERSEMIVFDCYGAGRYLDAESPRHRPAEAFLQISNEIAARLKLPPLLHRDPDLADFAERLRQASGVLEARDPSAWLVVAIDAADNAVHAAQVAAPPDTAFVHQLVRIGQLPPNVRLIISTRTSRLGSLNLDSRFQSLEVPGFSESETAVHVRLHWPGAPDEWIEDFHTLSSANPRVQSYALGMAGGEPSRALDTLRPHGRGVDQVFAEQVRESARRAGLTDADIERVLQGVMALPRPVPIRYLSPIVRRSEAHLREFATDLAPGLRLERDAIGFTDEDFEDFVRRVAGDLTPVIETVADLLVAAQQSDIYAAVHVAPALLAAGRRAAVLDLVQREGPPAVIHDPVLRREVQLQRMRIAMRVCRESGDVAEALLINLRGAAALKTDSAIRDALRRYPDLAVRFAGRSVAHMFLQEPDELECHGIFLLHRLAADAERGQNVNVREDARWLKAWMQHRNAILEAARRSDDRAVGWEIDDDDIAAEAIGYFRAFGPERAWSQLRRWQPASVRFRALLLAAPVLVAAGQGDLLAQTLVELGSAALEPTLRVPLSFRDGTFDAAPVAEALRLLHRRSVLDLSRRSGSSEVPAAERAYEECILTACELCVAAGRRDDAVLAILTKFGGPFEDRGVFEPPARIDLRLRALAVLARLDGERMVVRTLLPPRPDGAGEGTSDTRKAAARWDDQHQEWQDVAGPLVSLYDARAQILLGLVPREKYEALLDEALAHLERDAYRMTRRYRSFELRERAATAVLSLLGHAGTDSAVLWRHAEALAASGSTTFGPVQVERWVRAAARQELHPTLLARAAEIARHVQDAQMAAREQVDALCSIARALLPISSPDAEAIFLSALDAAAGIDEDAMHLLPLLSSLAVSSAASLEEGTRRHLARGNAIAIEDAAIRLSGYDHFPWSSAALGLSAWDFPFALAAVSRWDDEALVSRSKLLPVVLREGVSAGHLSPAVALALLPLLEQSPHPEFLKVITARSAEMSADRRDAMAERIAADELLTGSEGAGSHGQAVLEIVRTLRCAPEPAYWETSLAEHASFHAARRSQEGAQTQSGPVHREADAGPTAEDLIASFPWDSCDVSDPATLSEAVRSLTSGPTDAPYVPAAAVYRHVQQRVPIAARVRYLNALVSLMREQDLLAPDAAEALGEALAAWEEQPSVGVWLRGPMLQRLPGVLAAFLRGMSYRRNTLELLCRRIAGAEPALRIQVRDALVRGLELHDETLTAEDVYWLVGVIAEFVDAPVLGQVAIGLTEQLLGVVVERHRAAWNLGDLPTSVSSALGRAVFASLGDMDTRTRWRAAHALRRLAALGEADLIDSIVAEYNRREESLFRKPDAPFYWQAARLWLIVALCRTAEERPHQVARHAAFLIAAGTEPTFPHLLLRDFAARGVRALHAAGVGAVRTEDLESMAEALGSGRPRRRAPRSPRERRARSTEPVLRFHFDETDTIPYWYDHAVEIFTDVSMEAFLTRADRWVIDEWGATPTTSHWVEEPRRNRLDERRWGEWSHSHGGQPVVERYSTHLEWNAMWCAAGELLKDHTLRARESRWDDYHTLEGWLRRKGLTDPPGWMADSRSPRPTHLPLYVARVRSGWEEAAEEEDFRAEAGLAPGGRTLVVGASWENASPPVYTSSTVRAAYVTPSRALALLRALQTVESPHDFRLPDVGDDFEIRHGGHVLVGFLEHYEHEGGIDRNDPLRRDSSGIAAGLPEAVVAALGLRFVLHPVPGWEDAATGELVLRYECWSNRDPFPRHRNEEHGTTGWRLHIERSLLARLMERRKLDVLISVGIERRLKQYGSNELNSEDEASAYHSRIYLLRRGGELLTADGRAGTWAASGT